MNNGILQPDVFEFDLVFEKEPVCDVYVYWSRIKKRVLVSVQHKCSFEQHAVEKREVNMLDPDGCIKIVGNSFSSLVNQQILDKGSLYKQPYRYDQSYQYEKYDAGYFPEFSQADEVGCKINYKGERRKFNTIEL